MRKAPHPQLVTLRKLVIGRPAAVLAPLAVAGDDAAKIPWDLR